MAQNIVKFPKDLGESEEHQHFMVFRIYSNSSASLGSNTRTGSTSSSTVDSSAEGNMLRDLDSSRASNQPKAGDDDREGAAQRMASASARMQANEKRLRDQGVKPGDESRYHTDRKERLQDAAIENATSVVGAFFTDTTYSRAKKLNQDSLFVPFPQSISMTDGWNWETVSFQKSAVGEMMKGGWQEGLEKGLTDIVGGIGAMTGSENIGKLIQHSNRRVSNPRKETMFNEPSMRTFTFEFDFAPRDIDESENANAIIQLFKYHAAPELYKGANSLYTYPSEFQIYFVSHGKENKYIAKIDRCALTNIAVNYTNANMWSAFKNTSAPTHIKVSLELTELSLQSRNSLMELDGIDLRGGE